VSCSKTSPAAAEAAASDEGDGGLVPFVAPLSDSEDWGCACSRKVRSEWAAENATRPAALCECVHACNFDSLERRTIGQLVWVPRVLPVEPTRMCCCFHYCSVGAPTPMATSQRRVGRSGQFKPRKTSKAQPRQRPMPNMCSRTSRTTSPRTPRRRARSSRPWRRHESYRMRRTAARCGSARVR